MENYLLIIRVSAGKMISTALKIYTPMYNSVVVYHVAISFGK